MVFVNERVYVILLAAGTSTRMGGADKLRLRIGEKTLLEHSVLAATEARVGTVVVVTGADDYRDLLEGHEVRSVVNRDFSKGMAASIRAGVGACPSDASAYGILPGDMPFVRPETIRTLAGAVGVDRIVAPMHKGRQGHPVYFSSVYRDELLSLDGDVGARSIVVAHESSVLYVETDDDGVLRDIDSPKDANAHQKEH